MLNIPVIMIMGHICRLAILLVSLRPALAAPLIARYQPPPASSNPTNLLTTVADSDDDDIVYLNQNGQWVTQDGEVIDTRIDPIVPIDQPPSPTQPDITVNQFGQLVTPSGQIVTLTDNGQYLTQDGQVLDQNGNPIDGTGQLQGINSVTLNQFGQFVTPSGQIVTANGDGTYTAPDGQILDGSGNPVGGTGQPQRQTGITVNQFGQLVSPSGQILTLTDNGQYLTQDGQLLDVNGNPIVGTGQLQGITSVTLNQFGQFVTPSGQIVTPNGDGTYTTEDGRIVDDRGNPVGGSGAGFGDGGIFGNAGGQGGVVNNGDQRVVIHNGDWCHDTSIPEPENDYGTTGVCGVVRNPNGPNGVQPGEDPNPWEHGGLNPSAGGNNGSQCHDPSIPEPENDYGTTGDCGVVRNPWGGNSVLPGQNPDGSGTPDPEFIPGGQPDSGNDNW